MVSRSLLVIPIILNELGRGFLLANAMRKAGSVSGPFCADSHTFPASSAEFGAKWSERVAARFR